jgi:hypothetical protein
MIAFEEFCREMTDWEKADLIGGAIHRALPDTRTENELLGVLVATIQGFLEATNNAGQLLFSRFAFRLSEFDAPEPDIAYVRPDRRHLLGDEYMEGGPDIAVEIVSRDSVQRDYGENPLHGDYRAVQFKKFPYRLILPLSPTTHCSSSRLLTTVADRTTGGVAVV